MITKCRHSLAPSIVNLNHKFGKVICPISTYRMLQKPHCVGHPQIPISSKDIVMVARKNAELLRLAQFRIRLKSHVRRCIGILNGNGHEDGSRCDVFDM